jgi:hypothetical protein
MGVVFSNQFPDFIGIGSVGAAAIHDRYINLADHLHGLIATDAVSDGDGSSLNKALSNYSQVFEYGQRHACSKRNRSPLLYLWQCFFLWFF